MATSTTTAPCIENPGHGNDWIAIELVGVRSYRSGVGARIRVVLDEGGEGAESAAAIGHRRP